MTNAAPSPIVGDGSFTKFIIDRQGNVAARFEPSADLAEAEACVKALL